MAVMGALVVGAVLSAIYGMLAGGDAADPGRLSGAGGDANDTAAVLVAGGIIAAGLAAALRDKPFLRLAAAAAVPLCGFAVFLTLSRGGLIALGASLIAAVVMAGRHRGKVLMLAVAATLVTVMYFSVFAPAAAEQRVTGANGGTGRVDIWTVGWRMVEAHPLSGVGAGNFPIASVHYLLEPGVLKRDDFIVDTPKVAHNTYLDVLAELGVIGLALFASVILFSLVCGVRGARQAERVGDGQLEILARALVVALVGLLAADFFVSRQYSKQLWLLFALCPVLLELGRATVARGRGLARASDPL
jgi:O-antigen ligase